MLVGCFVVYDVGIVGGVGCVCVVDVCICLSVLYYICVLVVWWLVWGRLLVSVIWICIFLFYVYEENGVIFGCRI